MNADLARAADALFTIPADLPRDEWVRAGMAAQAAGIDFDTFDNWSAQAVNYDASAARHYARIRAQLERQGQPIGANDLWIAAQALAADATLVTDNEGEFRRVPGLALENWLRDEA